MNDQIHEELTLLEKELSRLDTATRDIETAKEISKNVVKSAENLVADFSMFYQKLDSSFKEVKNQHAHILGEYSKKFDTEITQLVEVSKNNVDQISEEYSQRLNQFDEKTNSVIADLEELLANNNELRNKIEAIFKELDELHLPLKFDKLDTTISSISQGIQNLQGRLDTLESNVIRETENQRKKISDEMEMITLGMNNIYKAMESKFATSEVSFVKLKKENRILGGLLIIILVLLVIQFFV